MKKILLTLAFIVSVSFLAMSQINYTDAQLFGSSRPASNAMEFNFGDISNSVVQHDFFVSNSNKVPITISKVEIPDGFGVIVVDKVIPAESVGKIIVLVYKDYVNQKGSFEQKIIVTTEFETVGGKSTKDVAFVVKGSL